MSIDFYCDVATPVGMADVAARVRDLLGGEPIIWGESIQVDASSLYVNVRELDERSTKWSQEDWGVASRISVSIQVKKFLPADEDYAANNDFSLATVRLVNDLDADAVLLINQDRMLMRRKDGVLTLFDWWNNWAAPEVVAKLPAGYVVTSGGLPESAAGSDRDA